MTRYIIYVAIAVGTVSCGKKFLEVVPQGSLVATTTSDYDKLMNDPAFYFSYGGGGLAEAQLMGDEVDAEADLFNTNGVTRPLYFTWSDTVYQHITVLPTMLRGELGQRYELNKIINEVMSSTEGTSAQKSALRGEALATRAWSNFQLASYYCKPYNVSTAAKDPGFPIITTADVNIAAFARGTVQQTYDSIIRDFSDAIPTLPLRQPSQTRMSKPAAEGLLGKVYLFMGRPQDALPLLNDALSVVTSTGAATLYDYNATFGPGGSFLPINSFSGPQSPGQNFNDTKEAVLSKVFGSGSYSGNITGNNGLVLTANAAALYGPNDFRLLFYTSNKPDGSPNAAGRLRKYGVQYSRWGLQLPELYLLSAECKARLGDLSGAKTAIESLRLRRMPAADATVPPAIANDQTALIRFIIDERTREFAGEGYRWNDMRRLSLDPLYSGITFTHTMFDYSGAGTGTVYTLRAPDRLVLRLPPYIVDTDPGFVQNP